VFISLFVLFVTASAGATGFNISYDCLPASSHIDMFDRDLLLALATMFVQGCQLFGVKCHQFLGVIEGHVAPFKGLTRNHSSTQALQGGGVRPTICAANMPSALPTGFRSS